jgi:uncharacterized membrane protein required for colicin V production
VAVNLLDGCILLIIMVSLIIGYKKGFIGALAGIASTLAGLAVAFIYRKEAADYLQQNYGVVTALTTFLEKHLVMTGGVSEPPGLLSSLPIVNEGLIQLHRQMAEFAYLIVAALCFLLLYLVGKGLVSFLCRILEKILNWGIIKGINRAGGMGIILAQNIVIMAVLLGILNSPLQLSAEMGIKGTNQVVVLMQDSILVPYLLKIFAWLQVLIDILV